MCDVPIIAVSAHDREEFYAQAVAAGCNEYISKPVDFDTLENVLGRLCPPGYEQAPTHMAGAISL
jgi:CheY-like chemotaxis protein